MKKHFHGFSKEQFDEEKNNFPYCEIPFIMQSWADIQCAEKDKEIERAKGLIETIYKKGIGFISNIWEDVDKEREWVEFKEKHDL